MTTPEDNQANNVTDAARIEPVTLRMLKRVQNDAWNAGYTRIPLRTLLSRRFVVTDLFQETPETDGETLTFCGVKAEQLTAAERRIPGAMFLQDSPGIARSSARKTRRDPRRIDSSLRQIIDHSGWAKMLALSQVGSQWETIVGKDIAAHTTVEEIEHGCVKVRATSTTWAVHLRSLLPQIMRNIDDTIGTGIVTQVIVKGPDQPSWSHGPRRVRGRGVRDTYA